MGLSSCRCLESADFELEENLKLMLMPNLWDPIYRQVDVLMRREHPLRTLKIKFTTSYRTMWTIPASFVGKMDTYI